MQKVKLYSTVTKWFMKFCLGCKNLNDESRSGRPKTMDSEVIEANLVRLSGKLNIAQSTVVCHLHDFCKGIQNCHVLVHITKILQHF